MLQTIDDFTIILPELTDMAARELKVYGGLDRLWRMVDPEGPSRDDFGEGSLRMSCNSSKYP
jgi:hypothetical protein